MTTTFASSPVADLATATPVEIDTRLAEISEAQAIAQDRADRYRELAAKATMSYQRDSYAESADDYQATADALSPEIFALQGEFANRGGWTRAFLAVTNGNGGHVHRFTGCSTCNNGIYRTSFAWVTEFSGADEAEIVEAAGERACTVCYPTAPVEVLERPTRIFTKDEQRKAEEKAAREAKKAAAAAAVVADPITGRVLYKTERAALNAAGSALDSLRWYSDGHPSADEWLGEVAEVVAALAAKTGADPVALRAELEAKADKKFTAKVKKIIKENRPGAWNYVADPEDFIPSVKNEARRLGLI